MLKAIHFREGLRYFSKSLKRRLFKLKCYEGGAKAICRQIVEDCWNGRYFKASVGHHCGFWARDFGFNVEALLKLGYKEEVLKCLAYTLEAYSRFGGITTTISPAGVPFDFPNVYSPDSVALLFYSLKKAGATGLVSRYKAFLNKEVARFYRVVVDQKTGLVRRGVHFSGARDFAVRDSSCYDNCMLALMAETTDELGLESPFEACYEEKIEEAFWTGSYFLDDLSGKRNLTSDANIFPFWTGVFDDKGMLKSVVGCIREEKLDSPFPIKYSSGREDRMLALEFFVPGWQRSCIWPLLAPIYISLVKRVYPRLAREYVRKYGAVIERDGTLRELYNPQGLPYASLFYAADEGMLWAASFLPFFQE